MHHHERKHAVKRDRSRGFSVVTETSGGREPHTRHPNMDCDQVGSVFAWQSIHLRNPLVLCQRSVRSLACFWSDSYQRKSWASALERRAVSVQWHRTYPRAVSSADVTSNHVAQWVSEMTGVQNPFEVTLPSGVVVMPTPGLQDSADDYVSVSELLPMPYIDLEVDSADPFISQDALGGGQHKDDKMGERAINLALEEGLPEERAEDETATQTGIAKGWKEASASMLDAQKALQAAEKSYKKLQHDFAAQTERTVET